MLFPCSKNLGLIDGILPAPPAPPSSGVDPGGLVVPLDPVDGILQVLDESDVELMPWRVILFVRRL